MTSFKKSLVLACAASVLGMGVALAQTDPNAAAPAAPGATMAAPADANGDMSAKPMMKKPMKHMKHKKHMKKKMMKKSM